MPLSIVIPVYNEQEILEKNVLRLAGFLKKIEKSFEIIIADNGSVDATPEIAGKLEKKFSFIRYIRINERGVGLAFKQAIKKAKYEQVVSLDADLTIDFENFIRECRQLLEKNFDVIVGSKKAGIQQRRLWRKIASDVYIFLTRLLLGLNFSDYSIGAKAFKKSKIIRFAKDFDAGSFYVIQALYYGKKAGLKMIEVPTRVSDTRKSRFNIIHESLYRLTQLIHFFLKERLMP